jgi:hypothetical protein
VVSDIEHIESQSLAGVSVIKVFFQPKANIQTAIAQVVASVQSQVRQLPPGITPPLVIKYSASSIPVMQLALSSPTLPEQTVFDAAVQTLRPQLITIPGVAVPFPYGGKTPDLGGPGYACAAVARPGAHRRGQRHQYAEPDPALRHGQVRRHRVFGQDQRLAGGGGRLE